MISDERLMKLSEIETCVGTTGEMMSIARELLALRKAAPCQHQWDTLKLVECGGSYQYCKLCGIKKVAD